MSANIQLEMEAKALHVDTCQESLQGRALSMLFNAGQKSPHGLPWPTLQALARIPGTAAGMWVPGFASQGHKDDV